MLDSLVSYTHSLSTILFVRCASTARLFFVFKCVVVGRLLLALRKKRLIHSPRLLCVSLEWMEVFTQFLHSCSLCAPRWQSKQTHGDTGVVEGCHLNECLSFYVFSTFFPLLFIPNSCCEPERCDVELLPLRPERLCYEHHFPAQQ